MDKKIEKIKTKFLQIYETFHSLSWTETSYLYKTHWLKWTFGRQKTGYDGFTLFINPFLIPSHVMILRFPEGSRIPPHLDKMKNARHYRLNIVIKSAKKGGEFICENPFFQSKYVNFFRSDICKHSVTKVEQGTRYVLSIGWSLS